jgi:hypothetical protein
MNLAHDLPHERIKRLVKIDQEHKTVPQLYASVFEELGELARELKIEEKVFGNFHKKPGKDGSKGEAVDLFICANIILHTDNGSPDVGNWLWPGRDGWIKDVDVFKLLGMLGRQLRNGYGLAQTCIDIFVQRGGSQEEFLTILNNKLDKWENTQKGA